MRAAAFAFSFCMMIPLVAAEPAADGPIRVACVGDSITYGSGIDDRARNSYPAVLGRLLGDGYEVRNFGVGGATLQKKGDKPYWTLDAFKDVSAFNPQIVIVKLGTNDTKPQNWHGVEPYKIDLLALLNHFKSLPEEPQIFVCTPVPVFRNAFGIREAVVRDEVAPTVRQAAETTKTRLIDLYAALKESGDDFPDGVHPNATGAKQLAESVAKAVRQHAGERSSNSEQGR